MTYKDKPIEPDIDMEGDDGQLCPIVIPKLKGKGVIAPKDRNETYWDQIELERRLGK